VKIKLGRVALVEKSGPFQLSPDGQYISPIAEEFLGAVPRSSGERVHIRFRLQDGKLLDIPLTREAVEQVQGYYGSRESGPREGFY